MTTIQENLRNLWYNIYKHTLFQVGISYVFDRRIYVYLLQIPISGIPVAYMKLKVNENVSLNEVCYYNY